MCPLYARDLFEEFLFPLLITHTLSILEYTNPRNVDKISRAFADITFIKRLENVGLSSLNSAGIQHLYAGLLPYFSRFWKMLSGLGVSTGLTPPVTEQ